MVVLYITDRGNQGGAGVAFISMLRQMKLMGVTPIVITGDNKINNILESENIQYLIAGHYTALESFSRDRFYWPLAYLKRLFRYWFSEYAAYKKICRNINLKEIDIIHTNSARSSIGGRISKKSNIPHIVHIREFADRDFNCVSLMPNYYNYLNETSSMFISVSKAVCNYWNDKGINSLKNKVIYDGVNNRIIKRVSKRNNNSQLKMVIAGGVVRTKGQHLAVEAIGNLPTNIRNNITLDVLGWFDKKYIEEMKDYASLHGYGDKIIFWGAVNDVHERLCHYDIGLMCSKSEGFGLVTVEYMHAGLGVIASDSGACPEIIDDRENGLLFRSGDSKDLSRCIEEFYNDRELMDQCANNAHVKAKELFTDEINASNILKLYTDILIKK